MNDSPASLMIIRPAETTDMDSLVTLLATLFSIEQDFVFDESRQRRGLSMMLENERGCLLVAVVKDQVIGMCSGQLMVSTAEGGLSLLVEDVVVAVQQRGQGVGWMLMEAMSHWATINNVSRLQLLADKNNTPGLDFYRHLGWQTTELICLRTYTSCRGAA